MQDIVDPFKLKRPAQSANAGGIVDPFKQDGPTTSPALAALNRPATRPEAVPPNRTWAQADQDLMRGVESGAAGLIKSAGDLYGLASGNVDNAVSRYGAEQQEKAAAGESEYLKAAKAARSEAIGQADGVLAETGTAILETLKRPALLGDTVASNLATLLPAGAAGRGAKIASTALGAGEATAAKVGVAAGLGTAAAQQATDVSRSAYDSALADTDWTANAEFNTRVASGEDPQLVKENLALGAARATFPAAAAISVASQFIPGGQAIERALVGGVARNVLTRPGIVGRAAGGVKAAVGEGFQEAIEEGGGQFAGNLVRQQTLDPNTDLGDQVGENAGIGFVGGAALGGVAGASQPVRPAGTLERAAQSAPPIQPAVDQPGTARGDIVQPGATASVMPADQLATNEPSGYERMDAERRAKDKPQGNIPLPTWVDEPTGQLREPTQDEVTAAMTLHMQSEVAAGRSARISTPAFAREWNATTDQVKQAKKDALATVEQAALDKVSTGTTPAADGTVDGGVPTMITNDMRTELKARAFDDEAIAKMTPAAAWQAINDPATDDLYAGTIPANPEATNAPDTTDEQPAAISDGAAGTGDIQANQPAIDDGATPGTSAAVADATPAGQPAAAQAGLTVAARTARMSELRAKRKAGEALDPASSSELLDLMEQDRHQAKVAGSGTPIEGVRNMEALAEMEADGTAPTGGRMFFDGDGFKTINDTLGHAAGDEVIRIVGEELAKALPNQILHRGGDEFLGTPIDEATARAGAERARAALAQVEIVGVDADGNEKRQLGIGISYGYGKDAAEAEADQYNDKDRRAKAGLRADRKGAETANRSTDTAQLEGSELQSGVDQGAPTGRPGLPEASAQVTPDAPDKAAIRDAAIARLEERERAKTITIPQVRELDRLKAAASEAAQQTIQPEPGISTKPAPPETATPTGELDTAPTQDQAAADVPSTELTPAAIERKPGKPIKAIADGAEGTAYTGRNEPIKFRYAVVEADQLVPSNHNDGRVNEAYPSELQPRDRTSAESITQVQRIAGDLTPARLGESPDIVNGAPLVGADGIVESGNGRVMALGTAPAAKRAEYAAWLAENAERFGLDADAVRGSKAPVLVRVRQGDASMDERARLGQEGNRSTQQAMNPVEVAKADARVINDDLMAGFRPSEDGDVLAASNNEFLQVFAKQLGGLEAAGLSADGKWTKQMRDRVNAAVFWKAYGDERLLHAFAADADADMKNVLTALGVSARDFALARAYGADDAGLDAGKLLADSVAIMREAREKGMTVQALLDQAQLFGDSRDPAAVNMAQWLGANARAPRRMGEALAEMGRSVRQELESRASGDMFGRQARTLQDIADETRQSDAARNKPASQSGLFTAGGQPRTSDAGRDRQSQSDESQRTKADAVPEPAAKPQEVAPPTVAEAAAESAASPNNDLADPTPAQHAAGNFKAGHVKLHGLDITIQVPKGGMRRGTDRNGKDWERPASDHYGHIRRTIGGDGEQVDVYLGPQAEDAAPKVFVIDQVKAGTKTFDESKVMLGFPNRTAARASYERNFPKGLKVFGGSTPMTLDQFKTWLKDGATKPAAAAVDDGKGEIGYEFGDKVRYTGTTQELYGGKFRDFVFLDGHRKGEAGTAKDKRTADAEEKTTKKPAPPPAAVKESLPTAEAEPTIKESLIVGAEVNTDDAGAELWYNRRNRSGNGVQWSDIEGLNETLRVKEATKSKVWPRPDYDALIEDGLQPVFAHLVKQVYDAVAAKPSIGRRIPTNADIQKYVETVNTIRTALFDWVRDSSKVGAALSKAIGQADLMQRGGPMSLSAVMGNGGGDTTLLDTVFPKPPGSSNRWKTDGKYNDNNDRANLVGSNKAARALTIAPQNFIDALKAVKDGWPNQEPWQRIYSFREYTSRDGKKTFDVIRAQRRVVTGLESRDAAVEFARKDYAEKLKNKDAGPAPDTIKVAAAQRTGVEHRAPGENVSSERLKETFAFRGVNFGNWMKGETPAKKRERQLHLNHAYDAMMDLAGIAGVEPKALGLNGMLGLAVGAQGSGNAAAHFVPGVNEINLTRETGAGSLAHEWAHAMDHYFAVQAGDVLARSENPFMTNWSGDETLTAGVRPEIRRAFNTIVTNARTREMTAEELADRERRGIEHYQSRIGGNLDTIREALAATKDSEQPLAEFDALAERLRDGDQGEGRMKTGRMVKGLKPRSKEAETISQVGWQIMELLRSSVSADRMDHTGPIMERLHSADAAAGALAYQKSNTAQRTTHKPQTVPTEYMKNARALESKSAVKKGEPYWSSNWELFARAFQSFVIDKLAETDARSDYLSNPQMSEEATKRMIEEGLVEGDRYPRGAERQRLNEGFTTLLAALQTRTGEDGNVSLFNSGYTTAEPDATEKHYAAIVAAVQPVVDGFGDNKPKLVIARSPEEFPAGVKKDPNYKRARGLYWPATGTVYVVAPNNESAERARETYTHEAVGHFGVDKIIDQHVKGGWQQLTNDIERLRINKLAGNADIRSAIDSVEDRYRNADRNTFAKELVAVMAERGLRNSFMGRIVAAVKAFARKLFPGIRFTDADIRALLQRSAEYLQGSDATQQDGSPAVAGAFSIDDQTQTPAFKRWFGNSKVVDADGKPMVVYHGTQREFFTFRPKVAAGWGAGIYFTDNKAATAEFGGGENGRVIDAYVSIKNPWMGVGIPGGADETKAWESATKKWRTLEDAWDEDGKLVGDVLRELGYDGVIANGSNGIDGLEIVAFSPRQVKSATGNTGAFNPENDDIRFSLPDEKPTYYSALRKTVDEAKGAPKAADGKAWTEWLDGAQRRGEVKGDERAWLGIDDWLAGQSKVTRAQISAFVAANEVQVSETLLGTGPTAARLRAVRFSELSDEAAARFPGSEFAVPDEWAVFDNDSPVGLFYGRDERAARESAARTMADVSDDGQTGTDAKYGEYVLPGGKNYRELLLTLPSLAPELPSGYEVKAFQGGYSVFGPDGEIGSGKTRGEALASAQKRLPPPAPLVLKWDQVTEDMIAADLPSGRVVNIGYDSQALENGAVLSITDEDGDGGSGEVQYGSIEEAKAAAVGYVIKKQETTPGFRSSHFDQRNILAHVRMNERVDADGKRMLFVEEVQSDWHQKGRKNGYGENVAPPPVRAAFDIAGPLNEALKRDDYLGFDTAVAARAAIMQYPDFAARWDVSADTLALATEYRQSIGANSQVAKVPDAPFKTSWPLLAMKRVLRYAAENGFERVGWTPGAMQAARFDLSKQVDKVVIDRRADGTFKVVAARGAYEQMNKVAANVDAVADMVGKDLAEKAAAQEPGSTKAYTGVDLKVGETGMRGFYDKVLPSELAKYAKRWGAKVGTATVAQLDREGWYVHPPHERTLNMWTLRNRDYSSLGIRYDSEADARAALAKKVDHQVHSIDVTPAMTASVMDGQPLFSLPAQSVDALDAIGKDPDETAWKNVKRWMTGAWQDFRPAALGVLQLRHLLELGEKLHPGMSHYADVVQAMQANRDQEINTVGVQTDEWKKWANEPGVAGFFGAQKQEAKDLGKLMHDATLLGPDPSKPYEPLTFQDSLEMHHPFNRQAVVERIKAIRGQIRGRSGDDKTEMYAKIAYLRSLPAREAARKAAYPGLVARWNALGNSKDVMHAVTNKDGLTIGAFNKKADADKLAAENAGSVVAAQPAPHAMFRAARDRYVQHSADVEAALIARVQALGLPDDQRRKLLATIRLQFETQRLSGVYFPLQRFGDYWISAKSPGENPEDAFLMFENYKQFEAANRRLKGMGYTITAQGRKDQDYKAKDAPSGTFVAEVVALAKQSGASREAQDEIYQLYLKTLPDLSMRKHSIHRKKVSGFDDDALRAFAKNGFHGAHQLSKLRYSHQLTAALDELQEASDNRRQQPDRSTAEQNASDAVLTELRKRHDWILSPKDSTAANTATGIGFFFYLGATPAAAVVNLTQGAIITFPALGARYGFGKASAMLSAATRDSVRTWGNIQKTLTLPEEQLAYKTLVAGGDIQRTQVHSLAGISEGDNLRTNPAWEKVMTTVGYLFQQMEVINRESAGMAAFRLARAGGNGVAPLSFDASVKYARDIINGTHFDYSNANRARFMQGNVAKVLTQFRSYSLGVSWFLGRNTYQIFKGESPEVRKQAARTMAGVMGMSALFSGAMGLPMMGMVATIANALQAMFGDDDEPWDFNTEFRAFLAEFLGADAAQVIADGAVNRLGADVAARVDMSELWLRSSDRQLEGRDAYFQALENMAGPTGGLVKNFYVGAQQIGEGQHWRGVETMLPKFIKDGMKAVRFHSEGANTLRGDPLIEDVTLPEQFIQAIGFTPSRLGEQYRLNSATKNYELHILNRRKSLLNAFALATRYQDADARAATIEKMRSFSATYPELAITPATVRASMKARARYSTQAEGGLVINKRVADRVRQQVGGGE